MKEYRVPCPALAKDRELGWGFTVLTHMAGERYPGPRNWLCVVCLGAARCDHRVAELFHAFLADAIYHPERYQGAPLRERWWALPVGDAEQGGNLPRDPERWSGGPEAIRSYRERMAADFVRLLRKVYPGVR